MDKQRIMEAHNAVGTALGKLADTVFVKGVHLTFVMRDPKNDECYMVISDDPDLDVVKDTIERSKTPALIAKPGKDLAVPETPEKPTAMVYARHLAVNMQCNCDLDNWQPELSTGHSHVCRIHKAAMVLAR